jgi:hypothetical protein
MAYTTINKGSSYFNTVIYTGTGSSNSLTGVGFQPDWVWIKKRNGTVGHRLYDAVRGVQNTLFSSDPAAEATGQTTTLTAFNSDGFTVISESGVNASGDTYVAWNWLANNTSGSSNTAGTITSTVAANTTAGFSVVSYTGTGANATVGHGLGATPKMIIVKNRSAIESWIVYHSTLGNTKFLELNDAGAEQTSSTIWNNTSPTSTLFTVGTNSKVNGNTNAMIAYCFAEVKGFSKFGSYTGNGSADGTFLYTGFKPAFLIVKRYNDAGYDWLMYDNKRQVEFNVVDDFLNPNTSSAETTGNANQSLDFLSNGVKFRGSGASSNGSGASYIYMAFAENPFVSSKGIPCTAR